MVYFGILIVGGNDVSAFPQRTENDDDEITSVGLA